MWTERTWRTGGRTDGQTGRKGRGWSSGWGGKGVDSRANGRTGPTRRGHADGQKRCGRGPARTDRRTGGWVYWQSAGRADGRIGERADKRVGLGLKGHIPRGWIHSWVPSPLASSEHECVGCLGVQWGPVRFHVKHPYLAPGLTCLV